MELRRLKVFASTVTLLVVALLAGLGCASYSALSKTNVPSTHPVVTSPSPTTRPATTTVSSAGSVTTSLPGASTAPTATATGDTPTTVRATSTTERPAVTTERPPQPVLVFDADEAMVHVEKLAAEIGVRRGGTEAELAASRYASDCLAGLGYEVTTVEVPVPNGLTTHNVIAVKEGASPLTILVGAHIDSKRPSPGGNDNASGAAAVLELARDVKDSDLAPTLAFVLFGNEEAIDDDPDHHHYGSRAFVRQMTGEQRAALVAMVSLDMIGYGDTLNVRTMGAGPSKLSDMLRAHADAAGIGLYYLKDPSTVGYSDHEPFERAGYPSVWLEWRDDPDYHTARDTFEHCDRTRIQVAGDLTLGFLAGLDERDLVDLRAARE